MRKFTAVLNAFLLGVSLAISQMPVFANTEKHPFKENNEVTANSTETYWTAERMKNAKPLSLPRSASNEISTLVPDVPTGVQESGSASRPLVNVPLQKGSLYTPNTTVSNDEIQPNNYGTKGARFTSSRLVPLSADTEYPYRTVGKLFFTQPGVGNFVCSAAVLRPRIILTAGHCVHKGSGGSNGFYTNFEFIPAYRDGAAPLGRWTWSRVTTTNTWATGGGTLPNAADYAIIELNDQSIGGAIRKIGDVTGYLGYTTNDLLPNHAHLLGYPGNLDSGEKMHQVTAGSYGSDANNGALYGSDMGNGSSGGPWVKNFGVPANGQVNGLDQNANMIIGVTSYAFTSTGPLAQGSSILDNRFIEILNTACAWKSGNC